MAWLNLPAEMLVKAGGWGLFSLGLILLLVANWRGWIVGGAEHRRALERERAWETAWRELSDKQSQRLDRFADTLEDVQRSQESTAAVLRALPHGTGGNRAGGRR